MPTPDPGSAQWDCTTGLMLLIVQTCLIVFLLLRDRDRNRFSHLRRERRLCDRTHSARLALAGGIANSIAHEVCQPLSAILNNTDAIDTLLKSGAVHNVELREILTDVRNDVMRTTDVVRELRALLSEHELQTCPVDLNGIARGTLPFIRQYAARQGTIVLMTLDPELPYALGDRIHLQQVLLSLLVNALDAMKSAPQDARVLHVRTIQRDSHLITVAVDDTRAGERGSHVPRVLRAHLFAELHGRNVELAIARDIVRAHRGELRAEKNPTGGATFSFTVPAADHISRA